MVKRTSNRKHRNIIHQLHKLQKRFNKKWNERNDSLGHYQKWQRIYRSVLGF